MSRYNCENCTHKVVCALWEMQNELCDSECTYYQPTLTPQNELLTIEDLREMDEPVWCACEPIEGGNGYWCLCRQGHITTPAGSFYEVEEIPHWTFYRRPPERQGGDADHA